MVLPSEILTCPMIHPLISLIELLFSQTNTSHL
jgi:hypothetical protein